MSTVESGCVLDVFLDRPLSIQYPQVIVCDKQQSVKYLSGLALALIGEQFEESEKLVRSWIFV